MFKKTIKEHGIEDFQWGMALQQTFAMSKYGNEMHKSIVNAAWFNVDTEIKNKYKIIQDTKE